MAKYLSAYRFLKQIRERLGRRQSCRPWLFLFLWIALGLGIGLGMQISQQQHYRQQVLDDAFSIVRFLPSTIQLSALGDVRALSQLLLARDQLSSILQVLHAPHWSLRLFPFSRPFGPFDEDILVFLLDFVPLLENLSSYRMELLRSAAIIQELSSLLILLQGMLEEQCCQSGAGTIGIEGIGELRALIVSLIQIHQEILQIGRFPVRSLYAVQHLEQKKVAFEQQLKALSESGVLLGAHQDAFQAFRETYYLSFYQRYKEWTVQMPEALRLSKIIQGSLGSLSGFLKQQASQAIVHGERNITAQGGNLLWFAVASLVGMVLLGLLALCQMLSHVREQKLATWLLARFREVCRAQLYVFGRMNRLLPEILIGKIKKEEILPVAGITAEGAKFVHRFIDQLRAHTLRIQRVSDELLVSYDLSEQFSTKVEDAYAGQSECLARLEDSVATFIKTHQSVVMSLVNFRQDYGDFLTHLENHVLRIKQIEEGANHLKLSLGVMHTRMQLVQQQLELVLRELSCLYNEIDEMKLRLLNMSLAWSTQSAQGSTGPDIDEMQKLNGSSARRAQRLSKQIQETAQLCHVLGKENHGNAQCVDIVQSHGSVGQALQALRVSACTQQQHELDKMVNCLMEQSDRGNEIVSHSKNVTIRAELLFKSSKSVISALERISCLSKKLDVLKDDVA